MKHTNTGLSFLGGALLGAATMYILDPETGDRRRHAIGAKAGGALRGTGEHLGDAWGQAQTIGADLIGHAQVLGAQLADGAQTTAADAASQISDHAAGARNQAYQHLKGLQDRVADLGHHLIGRARQAAGNARDNVDQSRQSVRESTHPFRHKIARAIDADHDHPVGHAAAYTSAAVGAVATGAAAMYFFDPEKGRDRREFAATQVTRCVQETGHVCRLVGQYVMRLWNRRTGSDEVHFDATNPIVGEELVRRVRAEIDHLLSNPAQVQLMADASGTVTLYGRVPANDLDQVLSAVKKVTGVTTVVNRLDASTTATSAGAPDSMESAPQL